MNIHLRIKEIVEKKNISREALAKELSVSSKTIHNYLNGITKISVEQLPIIAKSLKVSMDDLFQEIGTALIKSYSEKGSANLIEEPCPSCEKLKAEKMKLLEDLNELNAKYRHLIETGTIKKETVPENSKKAV